MLDGMTGLHNAEVITNAHMEETRKHFQAIHAANELREERKGNGLFQQLKAFVTFAHKATQEVAEVKPVATYETQTMPGI